MKPNERTQYIKQQRDAGMTLEDIGRELGVSREWIRQILVKHYGTADCCGAFRSTADLVRLVPCSPSLIDSLRHRGFITSVAIGRWNPDVVEKILELKIRKCRVCGKPTGRPVYCSDVCYHKFWEHRYLRMSEEEKQRHRSAVKRWQENHPERARKLQRKANHRHYMKLRRK